MGHNSRSFLQMKMAGPWVRQRDTAKSCQKWGDALFLTETSFKTPQQATSSSNMGCNLNSILCEVN